MTMRERASVIYQGRVQGVGFRAVCRSLARNSPITGFVRNLPDGSVELEAEGARREVEDFLVRIRQSHVGAFIQTERISWTSGNGRCKTFEILV